MESTNMISINWHPSDRELRWFAGLWFPLFWAIVGTLVGLRTGYWLDVSAAMAVVAVIGAVGLWRPQLVRPLYVGWMCAAFPIGWTVSHLLLAAIFYLLI